MNGPPAAHRISTTSVEPPAVPPPLGRRPSCCCPSGPDRTLLVCSTFNDYSHAAGRAAESCSGSGAAVCAAGHGAWGGSGAGQVRLRTADRWPPVLQQAERPNLKRPPARPLPSRSTALAAKTACENTQSGRCAAGAAAPAGRPPAAARLPPAAPPLLTHTLSSPRLQVAHHR